MRLRGGSGAAPGTVWCGVGAVVGAIRLGNRGDRSWRVARDGSGIRRCATDGGGRPTLGAGGGKGQDRARKVWSSVAGGLLAGVAGRGAGVGPGSGPAWMRRRTAAAALLLWPTDWFLAASLVRKGPRLVGKAGKWPYLVQKSK